MSTDEQHERTDTPPRPRPPERPEPQKRAERPPLLRYATLGALILAGVLVLVLLAVLRTKDSPAPAPPPESREADWKDPLPYEEPLSIDLQARAIRVDALITRTLLELGAEPESLEYLAFPARGEEGFRARSIGFVLLAAPERFHERLGGLLAQQVPDALLAASGPRQFSIIMDNVRTHEIFLDLPKTAPYAPQSRTPIDAQVVGRLAVVIDDMGEDVRLARALAETGLPLTFAAWPSASQLDAVVRLARENKLDLLVHLPMEPKGYPEMDPGPDALFVHMSPEEIQTTVERNLDLLPDAVGVNNHMGSRFTGNLEGMRSALETINGRGLFFLDSRTTGASQGYEAAKLTGTPFYGRDVFIDNKKDVAYIVGQLRKAEALARRRGMAVAIGHPHRETLAALRQWAAGSKGDVAVVGITELPMADE